MALKHQEVPGHERSQSGSAYGQQKRGDCRPHASGNHVTLNPRGHTLLEQFTEKPGHYLPEGHLVFFIHELMDHLDLSSIYADYDPEAGGRPPLAPRMMVAVWIYAYAVGIRSSRKVQAALVEDVAFRFLSGNQQPGYWALNRFRTRHREALSGLFAQSVHLAMRAGLVKLGHVAIDGSKLQANASKNKAMSYARMQAEEERLQQEISDYLDACDAVDAAEDAEFGDHDGHSLPEHLRRSSDRLAAIRKAKQEIGRASCREREKGRGGDI